VARKRSKRTAGRPIIIDENFLLINRLKTIERKLKVKKEKTRSLEKKIDALEERKKMNGLKMRKKSNGDKDGIIATDQNRVKLLKRKLKKRDLAIDIVVNVIKLSKLPLEKTEYETVISQTWPKFGNKIFIDCPATRKDMA
jgi:hypothetical protein